MKHTSNTLGLLLIAAFLLAACAPATGTPKPVTVTVGGTAGGTAGATSGAPTLAATAQPATAVSQPAATATRAPATATTAPLTFKSKDPTTLTYLALPDDPATLDPAFDYETGGGQIIQNTYDTLIFYNQADANTFVPQLATDVPSLSNGGITADGKTYTFKIRSGVKFHNGDTLTPADVAFTFQRGLLQGGLNSPQWLLFQPILGIAASRSGNNDITDLVDPSGKLGDDKKDLLKADPAKLLSACQSVAGAIVADDAASTVTFHLAQPWGPFLATLANQWGSIVDQKWIGANGGWDGDCRTWQNYYQSNVDDINKLGIGTLENGTGPYVLDHWTPKQEIVLKAFDGYWRATPAWPGGPTGAPRLKTILIRDASQFASRLAALRGGSSDLIDIEASSYWTQVDPFVGEICNAAGACTPAADPSQPLRVFKGQLATFRPDLFFNYDIDTTGGNDFIGSGKLDGQGIPPDFFNDLHVRKAFNYCFDWDAYIRGILGGEAVQSFDVMLPGEIGYSDQDPHYTYDPAHCQAEFQASTLKSADGKSLWDTGFHLSGVYSTGNPVYAAAMQILSQDLKAANPKFVLDPINLPNDTRNKAQEARKLPLDEFSWLEDIHDPHDWLVPYVTGTLAVRQSLPPDLVPQLSPFIGQGAEETDPAKRATIYKQFNQVFFDLAPDILLAVPQNRHYVQRWVQGYYDNPIYAGYYFYPLSKQ